MSATLPCFRALTHALREQNLARYACFAASNSRLLPRSESSGGPQAGLWPCLPQSAIQVPPASLRPCLQHLRRFCKWSEIDARMDTVQRLFGDAREEIELAREDVGTVYFNESADEARRLATECADAFEETLQLADEKQREALRQSMGLKMEQLKAEVAELDHAHDD